MWKRRYSEKTDSLEILVEVPMPTSENQKTFSIYSDFSKNFLTQQKVMDVLCLIYLAAGQAIQTLRTDKTN